MVPGSMTGMRRCSQRNRLSAGTCVLSHQGASPQTMTAPPAGCAPARLPSARASDATCSPTDLNAVIARIGIIWLPLTAATLSASLFAWKARTPLSFRSLPIDPSTSKNPATGDPG